MASTPTLVVVSGPPGSGKTTLAHRLSAAIGCPAICRDELKEGMLHAAPDVAPGLGDELSHRTLPLFFAVVGQLLDSGVTVVAEAAFQQRLWRPNLEPLRESASVVVVQCHVDGETARQRIRTRQRAAHADHTAIEVSQFDRLSTNDPSIRVDTTAGYLPSLSEIVAFIHSTRPR